MATEHHTDPRDLETRLTDWIVDKIDLVKRLATDNAVLVLRVIVFGLVIAVLGIAALILFVTIAIRMADAYLPIGGGVTARAGLPIFSSAVFFRSSASVHGFHVAPAAARWRSPASSICFSSP